MKKLIPILLCILVLTACQGKEKQDLYQAQFYDVFDTVTSLTIPAKDEAQAKERTDKIHEELVRLHKLFDNYNGYEGVDNVYTVNAAAGDHPVKVDKDLFALVEKSLEGYSTKSRNVNIAMGSVLSIWSDYREGHERGADFQGQDPNHENKEAQVPSMDLLKEANKHTRVEDVVLNKEDQTIYLRDKDMALDLGAVAKGYATEKVVQFMKEDLKMDSGLISAGGNVRALGKPITPGKETYNIGLQNPEALGDSPEEASNVFDTFGITDCSLVTSGDYQRYYIVDGKRYHHLIDPKTLMPGNYFRSVTIMTKDSGQADFLSTAVFLMPYEEGRKFVDSLDGVEAYWIFPDLSVKYTDGFAKVRQGKN